MAALILTTKELHHILGWCELAEKTAQLKADSAERGKRWDDRAAEAALVSELRPVRKKILAALLMWGETPRSD